MAPSVNGVFIIDMIQSSRRSKTVVLAYDVSRVVHWLLIDDLWPLLSRCCDCFCSGDVCFCCSFSLSSCCCTTDVVLSTAVTSDAMMMSYIIPVFLSGALKCVETRVDPLCLDNSSWSHPPWTWFGLQSECWGFKWDEACECSVLKNTNKSQYLTKWIELNNYTRFWYTMGYTLSVDFFPQWCHQEQKNKCLTFDFGSHTP